MCMTIGIILYLFIYKKIKKLLSYLRIYLLYFNKYLFILINKFIINTSLILLIMIIHFFNIFLLDYISIIPAPKGLLKIV